MVTQRQNNESGSFITFTKQQDLWMRTNEENEPCFIKKKFNVYFSINNIHTGNYDGKFRQIVKQLVKTITNYK